MMVPFAMQLEAAEAAAPGAAAAAVSLGASPEQVARAVLVAMRALPVAAAQLRGAQYFNMTCSHEDDNVDGPATGSGSDCTSCGEPSEEWHEQVLEQAVAQEVLPVPQPLQVQEIVSKQAAAQEMPPSCKPSKVLFQCLRRRFRKSTGRRKHLLRPWQRPPSSASLCFRRRFRKSRGNCQGSKARGSQGRSAAS